MSGLRQLLGRALDRPTLTTIHACYNRGRRDLMLRWAEAKGEAGMDAYRREKNAESIDGLCTPLGAAYGAG